MNVYQCWYHGMKGYCCRNHNSKWMFVPELGQINSRIHKQISLNDLVFNNTHAKHYELGLERRLQKLSISPFPILKSLFFPGKKAETVGGLLFGSI
jgi:hypothetical protein